MDRDFLRTDPNIRAGRRRVNGAAGRRSGSAQRVGERGRAPGLAGASEAPGPMGEDAGDDRRAARRDQFTGSVIATGSSTSAPPAAWRRRIPLVRLAYQP